jgi:hypothetical protein
MLNQKQCGCLKFLSVKHNWKFKKLNDIRDTGPDTENTDHGPDMWVFTDRLSTNQNREFLKSHIINSYIHVHIL